jgi:hypothetical protein
MSKHFLFNRAILGLIFLFFLNCDKITNPKEDQPSITVISPNGCEKWEIGSQHHIIWRSKNVSAVQIEFSTDNGSNWSYITEVVLSPQSEESYLWDVPIIETNEAKIKIYEITDNYETVDESDSCFSIVGDVDLYSSLKYYPLSVGNKWIYNSALKYYDNSSLQWETIHYLTMIKADKDTIMSNNKKYLKLIACTNTSKTKSGYFLPIDYQRVDSTEARVYRFDSEEEKNNYEYLIDDLYAPPGNNNLKSHRFEHWKPRWSYHYGTFVEMEKDTLIFNEMTSLKKYSEKYSWSHDDYELVKNIGLYYHYHLDEYNTFIDRLKGCVINLKVFGDTTFTSQ